VPLEPVDETVVLLPADAIRLGRTFENLFRNLYGGASSLRKSPLQGDLWPASGYFFFVDFFRPDFLAVFRFARSAALER
jgi:hypothetical protein